MNYSLFETIVKLKQDKLKKWLYSRLKGLGYKPINKDGFLYAAGTVPVLLVAHLDTVHKKQVSTVFYSTGRGMAAALEGIGGDDRCGVYMILQLIKQHKCHVLFCEDEEIGGIGAEKFTKSKIFPQVNYIVEMDRMGENDAVFYDCANDDFIDFVTSFGFVEDYGSFSDISIVAPHLGIAAVNISSGYYNAHTTNEFVVFAEMEASIIKIRNMLDTPTKCHEYIEAPFNSSKYWRSIMPLSAVCHDGFWLLVDGSWEYLSIDAADYYGIDSLGRVWILDKHEAVLDDDITDITDERGEKVCYQSKHAVYRSAATDDLWQNEEYSLPYYEEEEIDWGS